ncbi:MAG: hypothetical protein GY771_16880, partial [bacterium]|nr:hypothetical protein [bacterium]
MKHVTLTIAILALAAGAFADYGLDTSGVYFMADSAESFGPTYSWIDASSGTEWGPGDDSEYAVTTPFDIIFYGNTYASGSTITLGCNGAMSFDPGVNISYGSTIPSTGDAENVIAVWWDDMRGATGTSHLYDYSTTIGGENAWVFSYVDWYRYYSTGPGTWQMIIFETDGTNNSSIIFQYNDTDYGTSSYDNGNSAYAGIENAAGTE